MLNIGYHINKFPYQVRLHVEHLLLFLTIAELPYNQFIRIQRKHNYNTVESPCILAAHQKTCPNRPNIAWSAKRKSERSLLLCCSSEKGITLGH